MGTHPQVDINADMGEGFGRWTLGNDAGLMPFVTSTNIACGFHGGDPHIMRACVRLAKEHGTAVGAHVAFPDLIGFGRRRIDITPRELKDYVTYQVGALMGFAAAEGVTLEHVKPHSAFYKICLMEDAYAEAMAEAVRELRSDLILLMSGERVAAAVRRVGVRFASEGFIDLEYDEGGHYVPEWPKKMWQPEEVAARAVLLAKEGRVRLRGGGTLGLSAESMCLHGEAENATEIARAVCRGLKDAGVEVVPLRRLVDG